MTAEPIIAQINPDISCKSSITSLKVLCLGRDDVVVVRDFGRHPHRGVSEDGDGQRSRRPSMQHIRTRDQIQRPDTSREKERERGVEETSIINMVGIAENFTTNKHTHTLTWMKPELHRAQQNTQLPHTQPEPRTHSCFCCRLRNTSRERLPVRTASCRQLFRDARRTCTCI